MADLLSGLPLTSLPSPGHYGAPSANIRVRVVTSCAIATVTAARQQPAAVTDACSRHFRITLEDRSRVSGDERLSFVGIGPGRWIAVGDETPKFYTDLVAAFGATAAVCDQSDAYIVFDIEGPAVRDCLAKGPSIDFSPTAFPPGAAATTSMAHIGIIIWRSGDSERFRIAVPSSFAPGFVRQFFACAAEYGIDFA